MMGGFKQAARTKEKASFIGAKEWEGGLEFRNVTGFRCTFTGVFLFLGQHFNLNRGTAGLSSWSQMLYISY